MALGTYLEWSGMSQDNILNFSLADFFFNDSPSVLDPPTDFETWMKEPAVQYGFSFFEQEILGAPQVCTRIRSNLDGKERQIINLTSYNYLGLSTHPEVVQAAKEALDKYGLGSSGAPLLSGTLDIHVKLAKKLAKFKQKEDCLLFSSGLGANVGSIQGMLRKGDYLIMDEKCHKSLIDGGTLSGAKMLFFAHNDLDNLQVMLEKAKNKRTLVVVEGVYSMDGDLPKLPEILDLCERYGAGSYIDEAHSTLIFGKNGRGVAEHFGVEDRIGVSFGTLSKSFGGVGGFVCASKAMIRYLKGYSSPWNFSCAPSPAVTGGLLKALEVATRDSSLRDKMWENVNYLMKNLENLGLDLGETESQVIPIIIGSDGAKLMQYATSMQKRGLFLQPVDFPAVPAHARRFRISVSSQLSKEDMDETLNIIEDVLVKGVE